MPAVEGAKGSSSSKTAPVDDGSPSPPASALPPPLHGSADASATTGGIAPPACSSMRRRSSCVACARGGGLAVWLLGSDQRVCCTDHREAWREAAARARPAGRACTPATSRVHLRAGLYLRAWEGAHVRVRVHTPGPRTSASGMDGRSGKAADADRNGSRSASRAASRRRTLVTGRFPMPHGTMRPNGRMSVTTFRASPWYVTHLRRQYICLLADSNGRQYIGTRVMNS